MALPINGVLVLGRCVLRQLLIFQLLLEAVGKGTALGAALDDSDHLSGGGGKERCRQTQSALPQNANPDE